MPLTDNLVAYWKLDETSGTRNDAHGANHLTDNNTVTSATGRINTAADFESGNLEYLSRADNADLSTGNIDFTITAWVNLESVTGGEGIVCKDTAASDKEYRLDIDAGDGRFVLRVSSNGTSYTGSVKATTFGFPPTGQWIFVVAWHDAANDTLNIQVNNGTVDQTTGYTAGVFDSAGTFMLGRNEIGGAGYFDGLIDEAGLWKRVLTSQERTDLYNSGAGLAYPFTTDVTAQPGVGAGLLTGYTPPLRYTINMPDEL